MVLTQLKVGESCQVLKIKGNSNIKNKLQYFGITEGVKIWVIRRAPLGGPMQIKVRDFYLALRKTETDIIEVIL